MEVRLNKRGRRALKEEAGGSPSKRAPSAFGSLLSMYALPPTGEVTIPQFEEYAIHRLHVLREVEKMRASGMDREAFRGRVLEVCRKYGLNDREKDNTSHFVVRLAYCGSEDLRQWLRQQECRLFQARFEESGSDEVQAFFAENGLQYRPFRAKEPELRAALQRMATATGSSAARSADVDYFRVPFEEAIDLVGHRRVLLRDGFAFVPREQLVSIVVNKFRAHVGRELATTYRWTQNTVLDGRVRPLVRSLSKRHTGPAFRPSRLTSGQVTPDQIPALAERSFPMCMSRMQAHLKKEAHLRHEGRRTYGLFLKGIGLSLDDAVKFWRDSFARKVAGEQFTRQYVYNIRHMYGKEGRRKDYTPMNCMNIIHNQENGSSEVHSCPFKVSSEARLRADLLKRGVPPKELERIVELKNQHHYQMACVAVFKATHPKNPAHDMGNHPNEYFEASVAHFREQAEAASSGASSTAKDEAGGGGASTPSSSSAAAAAAPMRVD